jgi:hypothetical protein
MVIGAMALAAAMSVAAADPQLARMVALYDEICLQAFPDDKAVESIMAARSQREFSPAEVKVTMRDDPARGWEMEKGVSVWLEFPPFHACSVRWNAIERSWDCPCHGSRFDPIDGHVINGPAATALTRIGGAT